MAPKGVSVPSSFQNEIEEPVQSRGKLPRIKRSAAKETTKEHETIQPVRRQPGPLSSELRTSDVYDLETIDERPLRNVLSMIKAEPMSPLRRQRKVIGLAIDVRRNQLPNDDVQTCSHTKQAEALDTKTGQEGRVPQLKAYKRGSKRTVNSDNATLKLSEPPRGFPSSKRQKGSIGEKVAYREPTVGTVDEIEVNHGINKHTTSDAQRDVDDSNVGSNEVAFDHSGRTGLAHQVSDIQSTSKIRKKRRGRPSNAARLEDPGTLQVASHSESTVQTAQDTQAHGLDQINKEGRQTDAALSARPNQDADDVEERPQEPIAMESEKSSDVDNIEIVESEEQSDSQSERLPENDNLEPGKLSMHNNMEPEQHAQRDSTPPTQGMTHTAELDQQLDRGSNSPAGTSRHVGKDNAFVAEDNDNDGNHNDYNDEGNDNVETVTRNRGTKGLFDEKKQLRKSQNVLKEAGFDSTRTAKKLITKEIITLCEKAEEEFDILRNSGHSGDSNPRVPEEISSLGKLVLVIRGKDTSGKSDFNDHKLIRDIYQFTLPALIKLSSSSIRCYETIDRDNTSGFSVTTDSLQTIRRIVGFVVDVGISLDKDYKASAAEALKALTSESIRKKTYREVTLPLRTIRDRFTKRIDGERQTLNRTLVAEQQRAAIELQIEHEDLANERRKRILEIRRRWDMLHMDRTYIAGIISQRELRYLQKPDCSEGFDIIQVSEDGEPVDVLTVRIGPPPALIEKATEHMWSNKELLTLHDSLRDFAGSDVLSRTIRQHCGKRQLLNGYNVTEIVTMTSLLKEQLVQHQRKTQGHIDDWVEGIPVWTEPHVLGKVSEVGYGSAEEE